MDLAGLNLEKYIKTTHNHKITNKVLNFTLEC
jgi:hypothetical protein